VHFTGAIYDEQCVAPWMLSATLFCYPRNIGLSLLHAFGYGLPVVTSDDLAGHNPEIEALKPSVNGLLYRDGDLDDIVRQWLDLMNDPALRQRLSTAASRTVTDRYTLDHMVQGFLHLIGSVDGQMRQVQAVVPEAMANDRGL
jgi:glycosyltransferase involved in cell wall biosynthesis